MTNNDSFKNIDKIFEFELPNIVNIADSFLYKINEDKEKEIAEMAMNDPDLRAYAEFTERQKTLKSGTQMRPDWFYLEYIK